VAVGEFLLNAVYRKAYSQIVRKGDKASSYDNVMVITYFKLRMGVF
jgi:hypothetical protein